jgi:hypothetical protein
VSPPRSTGPPGRRPTAEGSVIQGTAARPQRHAARFIQCLLAT